MSDIHFLKKPAFFLIGALSGIAVFVILLECGLRAGGFIISSFQANKNRISVQQKDVYRILCLGDSSTQGQYPDLLEAALNKHGDRGIKFSVIDKGQAAATTAAILGNLEYNLDEFSPDMAVVMMGGSDFGISPQFSGKDPSRIMAVIRSLRVYKLARLLLLPVIPREAGESDPGDDVGLVNRGRAYCDIRQFKQAEECFKKASALNPRNYDACVGLGLIYRDRARVRREDSFKEAIDSNVRNNSACVKPGWGYGNAVQVPSPRVDLGRIFLDERESRQAEDYFKKAIEIDPGNAEAYIGLGWLYHYREQSRAAEDGFRENLEIDPSADLGWIYLDLGRPQDAEDYFKKAIDLDPRNSRAYFELGRLYYELGLSHKSSEALEFYEALRARYDALGQSVRAREASRKKSQPRLHSYNAQEIASYLKLKDILDRRNIKLVCAQYPMRNIEPLKVIFQGVDSGILFVDNEMSFKEAVEEYGYQAYFKDMYGGDFGHCTDKGNKLLADNIANIILTYTARK